MAKRAALADPVQVNRRMDPGVSSAETAPGSGALRTNRQLLVHMVGSYFTWYTVREMWSFHYGEAIVMTMRN